MVLPECSHIRERIWTLVRGHMEGLRTKTMRYCSLCRFDMCLGFALVYKYPDVIQAASFIFVSEEGMEGQGSESGTANLEIGNGA